MTPMSRSWLVAMLVASASCGHDELLERAEDEAAGRGPLTAAERAVIADRVQSVIEADGGLMRADASWAAGLTEVRFSDGGVDDEVLPYVPVGADEAELKVAPAAKGMAVLHRKHKFSGLQVDVLENQLVVLSGMETAAERKSREANGLDFENRLASELACTSINGTAMFMIAYRRPVDGLPHQHEIAFFDKPLWNAFVEYMGRAREQADFFGGVTQWDMRIHWNVLPTEQRKPWVLSGPEVQTVARPDLLAPSADMA